MRLRGERPAGAALAQVFGQADRELPASVADRPVDDDLEIAEQLLAAFAGACPSA
jgi:hypothetical protein